MARVNAWTVGIAGGPLESTLLRFVSDLAIALNDEDNLRILPIVSQGSTENVRDLLYLRGVDLAMTSSDALNEFKHNRRVSNIENRINVVAPMFLVEMNLLARPEIKRISDLEGKKVGFHTKGGAGEYTGRIIFERFGVKVDPLLINNAVAYERMKTGEVSAIIHPGGKPNDFLLKMKVEPGFHLLPIEFDKFNDFYVPSQLSSGDYPNLIPAGQKIDTIAIIALLAAYNWPQEHERFRRISRFIDQLVARFDSLRKPPFHPQWRSVNLEAKVPGWNRYWYVDAALKKQEKQAGSASAPTAVDTKWLRSRINRMAPDNPAEQERLFQEFVRWKNGKQSP